MPLVRRNFRIVMALLALMTGLSAMGCGNQNADGPTPKPSMSSAATVYDEDRLLDAGESILAASRQGDLPKVSSVTAMSDRTGLTVYIPSGLGDVDAKEFEAVAEVPVTIASGEAPKPTGG